MTFLLRTTCVVMFLAVATSSAASDGELAWTNVAFCNGADICVTMSSKAGEGLETLSITDKGRPVGNLPKPGNDLPFPLLQDTRLVSVARSDGGYANRLEVAFLDSAMRKFIYQVSFYQGNVYKTEVVAPFPAPI